MQKKKKGLKIQNDSPFSSPELFLTAHELDQSLLIRLPPLQVHCGGVHHLWLQKQIPRFFVQPVLWGRMLLQKGEQNAHENKKNYIHCLVGPQLIYLLSRKKMHWGDPKHVMKPKDEGAKSPDIIQNTSIF